MTRLFDAKPFIIAEVGSNWRTITHAVESIGIAKAVGADAVKFQAFNSHALYGFSRPWGDQFALPISWLPALKEKADACGIEFMCTAFSPEMVAIVDPFVGVHKVASSDLSYHHLLRAVAKTGKPALLSTGSSSAGDIQLALRDLPEAILLYCVAAYPSRTVDLRVMAKLREVFDCPVGFSDHTTDILGAPLQACLQGALVLEKHFTAFPDLDTPDRRHSLTPDEFKTMVDAIRGKTQPVIGPTPEERDMVLRHNRRLIATSDIAVGETLQYGVNFGAYRSLEDDSHGLTPFAWQSVEGRVAAKELKLGKGVGPGDFVAR